MSKTNKEWMRDITQLCEAEKIPIPPMDELDKAALRLMYDSLAKMSAPADTTALVTDAGANALPVGANVEPKGPVVAPGKSLICKIGIVGEGEPVKREYYPPGEDGDKRLADLVEKGYIVEG